MSYAIIIVLLYVILSQIDPAKWTVDQVCKWLELVGLGSYRAVFRGDHYIYLSSYIISMCTSTERNVTGKRLLQLDIQLFGKCSNNHPL